MADLKGLSALTDIATAQWRLGRLGELNRLDIHLAQGVDRGAVQQVIQPMLPAGVHVAAVETLEQAVEAAAEEASPGDVVLLSPAAASFDQFRDFEHRGEEFKRLVRTRGG